MAKRGEDWRPDFEQALGETFGDYVSPPVPFEDASPHDPEIQRQFEIAVRVAESTGEPDHADVDHCLAGPAQDSACAPG